MDKLLTIKQVAETLSVSQETLRTWDRDGKLPSVRSQGGHRRWRESDINEYMRIKTRGFNMNKKNKQDFVRIITDVDKNGIHVSPLMLAFLIGKGIEDASNYSFDPCEATFLPKEEIHEIHYNKHVKNTYIVNIKGTDMFDSFFMIPMNDEIILKLQTFEYVK